MNTDMLMEKIVPLFDHAKEIMASAVPLREEVRKMCEQNLCGSYGKSWTCPPAIAPLDQLRKDLLPFDRFVIVDKVYTLEDSYDWEGMVKSAKNFQTRILRLKKEVAPLAGENPFKMLGAGSCQVCRTCTYSSQEPCRNPEEAVFSVEAFGIDVMKMMADNGMKYNNGQGTVTYIGGLFYTAPVS